MAEFLMVKAPLSNDEAKALLAEAWDLALAENAQKPDPQVDELVNSKVLSIRYALITQILGKVTDPRRSVLVAQSVEGSDGAWDARSFAKEVVVPWEHENKHFLGGSGDPYVSNPLRRPRLDDQQKNVKFKDEWHKLVALLGPLDSAGPADLRKAFRRVLESCVRKISSDSFSYLIPNRIDQRRLEYIVKEFLSEPSAGLRPLAVATALFKIIGDGFSLYQEVRSQGLNEADAARGVPGDIMCYDQDDHVCLAVEVKGSELTLAHVEETTEKAKRSDQEISNLIFAVPDVRKDDSDEIQSRIFHRWTENLNLYVVSLPDLVATTFVLLDESWRIRFLREIGHQLDERRDHATRRSWDELLTKIQNG